MRAVAKETKTKTADREPLDCFVLMPFKPDLNEVYSKALAPAVHAVPGLRCTRADEIYGPRPIMPDVWHSIRTSHFIIADLTGRNPNVLYELGLSHAIQKPVILLSQNIEDVPFDLKHVRVVLYRNTEQGRKKLRAELEKHVQVLIKETGSRSANRKYSVLERAAEVTTQLPKSTARLLTSLQSKDPKKVIHVLEKIEEEYEYGRRWKPHDPRVVHQIRTLIHSELPEIQAAAIRTLGRAGSGVHASSLYPYLSSDNPALMEASIVSLGRLHDSYAVRRLVAMSEDSAVEPGMEALLESLGRIGTHRAIDFLSSLALDSRGDETVRCAALKGLTFAADGDKALLSMDIQKLGTEERCELARGLGKMECPYALGERERLEGQIRGLLEDNSPEVRGRALAAWCLQSFEDFDGKLEREQFLTRFSQSNQAELDACTGALGEYKPAFTPAEGPLLAKLSRKYPVLLDYVVWILNKIGDTSVTDFMLWAYKSSDVNSLWVLDFFTRNPSKRAVNLQRQEISTEEDPSRVCLAAVGLLRNEQEDAIDSLLAHAGEAYEWVKHIVREYLAERIEQETSPSTKKAIQGLLKKLPKTGRD
jgi:hypothetical protein